MAKLPPKPLQSEILQAVSSAKTKKQKIEILQEYRSPALVSLFVWNYDDSVKSAIPAGDVPYTPNDAPTPEAQSKLASQYRTLYNYVKGGNDALRGYPTKKIYENLSKMIDASEERGIKVFLMQIRILPNYGKRYQTQFESIYPTLSEEKEVILPKFPQLEEWLKKFYKINPYILKTQTRPLIPD